jgi:anaerobic selenocysteine-containing dehydrogenase
MEITRRHFIALLVGGAAGIQATPLPWKLTDDIAIWTQNWPWIPVPPTGEFKEATSVCNLCPGGCGILVRKVDTRAVKIEGRTDYPVNPGGICPVGMGGLQLLYDRNIRFTGPMKRGGPRGSGRFMSISWDEAISTVADRISRLRQEGRPETLVVVNGNPDRSTLSLLIERLSRAVGSPNYVTIPSIEDTYRMGITLMQGSDGPMAYDLENSDYVLSFGCGLLEGWGAPGRIINAWGLWHAGDPAKRKTKIVQIESRASNTASKADQWVAPRTGTEAALALGLAHVMVKEGFYDREFVTTHSYGFEAFSRMLMESYPPARVAKITGLAPADIVTLARDFCKARAPLALYGRGKGSLNGGLYEFMSVHSLNALAGSINRPGGILVTDPLPLSPLPELQLDTVAIKGLKNPRLDSAGTQAYPFTRSLINKVADAILSGPPSVDTLLAFSANPVYTLPFGGKFKRVLKKIPFIVSFSPFQDETALMADLILPDHTYLEKMDDIVWPAGLQYPLYGLAKPVVEPIYDTKSAGDIIIRFANALDGSVKSSFPWEDFEEVLKARAKGLFDSQGGLVKWRGTEPPWRWRKGAPGPTPADTSFDDMWKKLKSGGLWYRPLYTNDIGKHVFGTPSGKFEFLSTQIQAAVGDLAQKSSTDKALNNMGIGVKGAEAFMPHYEPVESGVYPSTYPLRMLPYEMINLASRWVVSPPFLYKTLFDNQVRKEDSFAALNPKTGAEYGLKEGDRVEVRSPVGKARARVHLFSGAMPGIVYLPLGLGHTAYDEFSRGKGINPNNIIEATRDPLSGHPVWWNTPVQLTKI